MPGTPTRAFATLGELVASFAGRGSRPALVAFGREGTTTVSYAALATAIARTAHALRGRGLTPGERVALSGPNGPDWIVAYFGIVAAGGVAVPLDPQSTPDGFGAALAHAQPEIMITTAALRQAVERQAPSGLRFVTLEGQGPDSLRALRDEGPEAPLPDIDGAQPAALLFTSGTTGAPKAVPLTHRNFSANVSELLAAKLIDPADRVLQPLPLHHTYPFTVGLLATLATGATLVLPSGVSGPEILAACSAARPTALVAVPRLLQALWDGVLAAVLARGPTKARVFHSLLAVSIAMRRYTGLRAGRWLFRSVHARLGGALDLVGCGGAQLPAELAWNLEGLGWRVLTGYGLTETSPVLTFNRRGAARLGSEGRPLPGVDVRVATSASNAPAEILARGPSVFAGYWHDADATATAFTDDGWFRTGDLGRFDSHGYLHVVGRSKELVVLADGKKFFPEPLEKSYGACPSVLEVGVFERGGQLAAVFVLDEDAVRRRGALREAAQLREELEDVASRLPPYQRIVQYRVVRTALPRTQLGKLRRHLLPALFDAAAKTIGAAPAQPLGAADRALVETPLGRSVWQWLQTRFPDHTLTPETSPQLDLAIDSLGWVGLTLEIERRFEVMLDSERLSRVLTLRGLLEEIAAAAANRGAPARATPRLSPPGLGPRILGGLVFVAVRLLVRLGLRLAVEGRERLPSGPMVIAPNHASYLDPLVVAAALPWRQLRRTYWAGWVGVTHATPLRRWLSRATQVFPVDPDRDLAAAVRTARELLDAGYSVVWFPEGRRSPTGELTPFQSGVGLLLPGRHAVAVPTAITGTFAAWPKHRRWPHSGSVSVTFGNALDYPAGLGAAEIARQLEQAVRALLGARAEPATAKPAACRPGGVTRMSPLPTEVALRDGRRATIRAIRRDDAPRTAAFIAGLSAQSKHTLFLGGIAELSDEALHRLCDADAANDMALVAVAADAVTGVERQVGVCRYAGADAPDGAEISVAVADDFQHQGLGTLLLRELIDHARDRGVRRLYSVDTLTNEPMRRLARALGFTERPDRDDIHQVVYSLRLERP
jgi:long-chain acyl-CoA synthetase